jgi:hypothetical protein
MAAAHGTSDTERCSWCGAAVAVDDGFRAAEHPGERVAVFCRLEHVVPWAIQGAHWDPGDTGDGGPGTGDCAHCGAALGDVYVRLVRHRGAHRIPDAFCSVDHLAAWASDGGRWR